MSREDEEQPLRRRSSDSRPPSAWQDPKTWVSILGVLLTLMITVCTFIWGQLATLNGNVQALNNSMIETRSKQGEKISTLEDKQRTTDAKLDKFITDQNAYNYDQVKMLTKITTQLGMRDQAKEK